MSYETPKYDEASVKVFLKAAKDIKDFNALDDMIKELLPLTHGGPGGDDVLTRILYEEARQIMLESKLEYVPVKTGRLRSSGLVMIPVVSGGSYTIRMGYYVPYAQRQHEEHKTKSKFLEIPLRNALESGTFQERVARRYAAEMGFE